MDKTKSIKPGIVNGVPQFTLRTLGHACAHQPHQFRPIPKHLIRMIKPGWEVSVWIEGVDQPGPCAEICWGIVRHVNTMEKHYIVQIINDLKKTELHGVGKGMQINVPERSILNATPGR